MYGGTGCGKTMLMDMYFDHATISKSRIHFHKFMLDIHQRLHSLRKQGANTSGLDPLNMVAAQIADECGRLLCLDEFQVTDVADAMMLKRLFTVLWEKGLVVIATSNRAPDELYWGGLNRDVFVPFIPLLKSRCEVVDMRGSPDYRKLHELQGNMYYFPLDTGAAQYIESMWSTLTDNSPYTAREIKVQMGRSLNVEKSWCDESTTSSVALFHFEELCDRPLGAADYMAVAREFSTVLISNIPIFDTANRNQMRRFITLIDILYDAGTQLVCSAAAAPNDLVPKILEPTPTEKIYNQYQKTKNDTDDKKGAADPDKKEEKVQDSGPTSKVMPFGGSSGRNTTTLQSEGGSVEWSATGLPSSLADLNPRVREDESFAFERTVSRLLEMQSTEYITRRG